VKSIERAQPVEFGESAEQVGQCHDERHELADWVKRTSSVGLVRFSASPLV